MELEIKVRWCRGLTAFNFFQKLTVFAAVSVTSENDKIQLTQDQKQEQKTPVDENGEGNPEWNHSMKFDLRPLNSINPNLNDFSLLFELRNPGQFFGDKIIGEVRVPLKDLIQSVGGEFVRFVSYEVRNSEGKHNGVLDFSYKVIGNNTSSNHDVQITGYHHHHYHHYHDQLLDQSHQQHFTNSDIHVIGYHHHHHHHQEQQHQLNDSGHHHHHHQNDSVLVSESEYIQYPKIDLDDFNPIALAPPQVYPPYSSSSSSTSYSSSSSCTETTAIHHHPHAPSLYPPPAPSQTWAPPAHSPSHYPPPPPPQPHVYPPPMQPYGDPHWGYQRPPGYHHW